MFCLVKVGRKEALCFGMASTFKCALNRTRTKSKSSSNIPSDSSLGSTSVNKDSQSLCSVCEKCINDETEELIFCDGICKSWMHRTCAGLSRIAFNASSESDDDSFCHYCSTKCMRDKIKALRERVSSLEASLKLHSTPTTETGSSKSYSDVVQSKSRML